MSGEANAGFDSDVVPFTAMAIGDTVVQTSDADGSASNGDAGSFSLTDLEIFVENSSNGALTFTFSYEAAVGASVSGSPTDGDDAFAFALTAVFDELDSVDLLFEAQADLLFGPLSDSDGDVGTFSFTLGPSEVNFIAGLIDTQGLASATGAIPEPASLALLAAGLVGLGAARRRAAA